MMLIISRIILTVFLGWLIYLVWVSNVDLVSWAYKKSKALLPIAENNTIQSGAAQAQDANRIITLKQKSMIVDILLTNRGSISIVYVRGDRRAEQFAEEIRDIFNTAYWHTSIDGANFLGFDRGLIVSANTMSDRINVIIKAFDAGEINIKSWLDPHMKEKEIELKVGRP